MLPPRRTSEEHYGWLLQPPSPSPGEYDEQSVLTEYVWRHYPHLLTPQEARAGLYTSPMDRPAALDSKGPGFADFLDRTHGVVEMRQLEAELRNGRRALFERVRERILREHALEVVVNRCPACSRIVRSPKARQCLWCKHTWHSTCPQVRDGKTD